jgi:diaminobutyrate-2-oxoglutarate transaminase
MTEPSAPLVIGRDDFGDGDVWSGAGRADEFDELESAVRVYCRAFDTIFAHASGPWMFDQSGRRYLDFLAGAGTLSYGHNNPRIKAAVIAYLQADGVLHSLDLHTTAKLAFLRKFRDVILAPRGLEYRIQFCGPTGANAVEAALKLARKATGRRTVVAFSNAYHGCSLGALAATANSAMRAAAGVSLDNVVRLPFENYDGTAAHDDYRGGTFDAPRELDAMLAPGGGIEPPAAVIVETVQAEGGVHVASDDWLRRLAEVARRHGIVLIVDDIQAGCGRTGTFFSFERTGIVPDIVCLSKAIGGIGLPMAITLIRPDLDVWLPGEHTGTFRGNNLAFVGGAAALDYWRDPMFRDALQRRGALLRERVAAIRAHHPKFCVDVRGLGMIQGLACAHPGQAAAIRRHAFQRGLLLETCGPRDEVVKLLPPLTIDAQFRCRCRAACQRLAAVAGEAG